MLLAPVHYALRILNVAAAVFAAGQLGELLTDLQSVVALVRPASGVALAAALIWGARVWPGVALGSALLHLSLQDRFAEVLLAPLGNTLSLLLGTALLRKAGLAPGLERVRDVLALAVLGAGVSPLPAALFGALGHRASESLFLVATEWWLGDAMGILLVCPALLCWSASARPWAPPRSGPEPHLWLFGLLAATFLAYGDLLPASLRHPQLPFVVFPFLGWAALRFDQRTTTGALLLISAVAVTTTGLGLGPFARTQLQTGLIYLLTYLALVSLTALILSAVIVERTSAEEKLRESEARFRTLAENSHIGIWHMTAEGRPMYVNPALCEMLEGSDARLLTEETFQRFFSEDSLERVREEHMRRRRGESTTYEAKLVGLRSGRRDVIVCGVPLMRPDGQLHSTIATFTDITQRKQAEETLRASQEMLRLVLDNIPLHVFWKDTQCVYLGCNNNAARIAGLSSPADIVGKTDYDLPSTDEEAAHFQAWDRRVMESDKAEYRILEPLHLPGGAAGWLETTKVPLHDARGKVIGVLGLFEDVTERRRAEELLRRSEERFRGCFELGLIGIAITSPETGWMEVNNWLCEALGYSREELVGMTWAELTHPDDLEADLVQFRRVLAGEIDGYGMDKRFLRKGGAVMHSTISVRCVRRPGGAVEHFVALVLDVTGRKTAEDAIRSHQEEMFRRQAREKELAEAELARVRGQLVRTTRLSALGQMAASIAHELRNPLGAIRNAAFLLRRRAPAEGGKWSEYLDIVEQEITASDRIISNLLELSRPKEPMRENVDLGQLVREVFGRLHPPPGVRWSLTASPEPFVLLADKVQLRQVLDNLIKNALDAADETGTISLDARAADGYANLIIQDDGPGVSRDHREALFEPLFSTKVKGTGLGLFISRQIAEGHGGSLELQEVPRGASFLLRLPLMPPPP